MSMYKEIKISKYFQSDWSLFIAFLEFFLVIILGFIGIVVGNEYSVWLGVFIGGVLAGLVAANMGERLMEY